MRIFAAVPGVYSALLVHYILEHIQMASKQFSIDDVAKHNRQGDLVSTMPFRDDTCLIP